MKQKYFALMIAMCVGMTLSAQNQNYSRSRFHRHFPTNRIAFQAKVDRNDVIDCAEGYNLSASDMDKDSWQAKVSENKPNEAHFNRVLLSNVSAGDTVYVQMKVKERAREFLKYAKSKGNFSSRSEYRDNMNKKFMNSFSGKRNYGKFNYLGTTENENGEERTLKFIVTEDGQFVAHNIFHRSFEINSIKVAPALDETTSAGSPTRTTRNKNDREWIHYATGLQVINPIRGEIYIHEGQKVVYKGE